MKKKKKPFLSCSEATSAAAREVKLSGPELGAQRRCGSGVGKIKQQNKIKGKGFGGGAPSSEAQLAAERYSTLPDGQSHPGSAPGFTGARCPPRRALKIPGSGGGCAGAGAPRGRGEPGPPRSHLPGSLLEYFIKLPLPSGASARPVKVT